MRRCVGLSWLLLAVGALGAPPASAQCSFLGGFQPLSPRANAEVPRLPEFRFFDQVDGRFSPGLALRALDDEEDTQVLAPIDDSVNVLQALSPLRPDVAYALELQDRFCEDCGEQVLQVQATDREWPAAPRPSIVSIAPIPAWSLEPCYANDTLFDGSSERATWLHVVLDDVPDPDLRLDLVARFQDATFGTTREVVGRYPTAHTTEGPGGVLLIDNPPNGAAAVIEARFVGLDGVPGPAATIDTVVNPPGAFGGGCAGHPGRVPWLALGALLGALGLVRRRGSR